MSGIGKRLRSHNAPFYTIGHSQAIMGQVCMYVLEHKRRCLAGQCLEQAAGITAPFLITETTMSPLVQGNIHTLLRPQYTSTFDKAVSWTPTHGIGVLNTTPFALFKYLYYPQVATEQYSSLSTLSISFVFPALCLVFSKSSTGASLLVYKA